MPQSVTILPRSSPRVEGLFEPIGLDSWGVVVADDFQCRYRAREVPMIAFPFGGGPSFFCYFSSARSGEKENFLPNPIMLSVVSHGHQSKYLGRETEAGCNGRIQMRDKPSLLGSEGEDGNAIAM